MAAPDRSAPEGIVAFRVPLPQTMVESHDFHNLYQLARTRGSIGQLILVEIKDWFDINQNGWGNEDLGECDDLSTVY